MMDVKGQVHQYPYCTLPSEGMIECWENDSSKHIYVSITSGHRHIFLWYPNSPDRMESIITYIWKRFMTLGYQLQRSTLWTPEKVCKDDIAIFSPRMTLLSLPEEASGLCLKLRKHDIWLTNLASADQSYHMVQSIIVMYREYGNNVILTIKWK